MAKTVILFSVSDETVTKACRLLAVLVGLWLSPTWFLLQQALQPYVDLNLLQGLDPAAIIALLLRLDALSSEVLLGHVAPVLVICLLGSVLYLYACSLLGETLARPVAHGLRKVAAV